MQIETTLFTLKNAIKKKKLIYQFWSCHWIRGDETSSEVILDFDFESQLALHSKRDNLKLKFFIVCLENVTV